MGVIIVNGIEYSGAGGGSGDIRYLTQAEYDALPDSKYTDDVEYRITDAGIDEITASNVGYRNSVSGLGATTVQQAIDKLKESFSIKNVSCEITTDGWGLASWQQFVPSDSITLRVKASMPTGHDSICDVIANYGYFYCSLDKDSALTRAKNATLSATIYYV